MKAKLGTSAAGPNDSLQAMVAMVEKKEKDAMQLEKLKQQREAEERKRQDEIARLKTESEAKRRAEIEKDIAAYEKIANSPYGKDMAASAWQSLINKYPDAKEVAVGDTDALKGAFGLPGGFVFVKGGCFQMGDAFGEADEKPVHEVCVSDFYMGKYEVTQAEWQKVMGNNPSNLKDCGNCPVENVSWHAVQDFLNNLNQQTGKKYRLPTEAEWEYAARSGGKNEKWAGTSSESKLGDYAWYASNSGGKTHPVGQKKPNGMGLYDMSGNVWEWTADWYDEEYYQNSPKDNPKGASSGSSRTLRGGSWLYSLRFVLASYRYRHEPSFRDNSYGFRLSCSAQ